jgi:hypothetical protein
MAPSTPLGSMRACIRATLAVLLAIGATATATPAGAAEPGEALPPPRIADRGGDVPTSLFGTWISHRELLVYSFYEYTTNDGNEYVPSELGFPGDGEYTGKLDEHEALIFLGYGLSPRLAVELEAAVWASAEFTKAPDDPSDVPARIEESGLGDVEAQLRWLWSAETAKRPLLYGFLEVVFPFQKDELLLGTQDWESALGFGVVRGFRWGTLDGRVSAKYDAEDGQVEPGEYAVAYLRRTAPRLKWVASLEGEDDELSLIGEAQWKIAGRSVLKLNCGFGLTEKAPDLAPEIGVIFSLGARRRGSE